MQNQLKHEVYNVLSGAVEVRFGATIQAIARYLNNGTAPGRRTEESKHFKEQEEQRLKDYITANGLWIDSIDFSQYISEGAEQKVYLEGFNRVFKLNDSIYYNCWQDYFYNLLLHNFFFTDTAYNLLGFTTDNDTLYAVVQQTYVYSTEKTDLEQVKSFMLQNGFENNRNNDYINHELGIILEDLHDENVLTQNKMLYFIDTVFYLTDNFWMA
ncbi:hypothetical protein GR160_08400 [Flavobacterium sp. Sd200]|uniref:putative polyvalent protein kinase domain-containing protein n=1 Tax=Flavobacterium sp. Sd200 TaxID=2692211 RepID=UPI001371AB2E|nr:hypothetical protein [Flavobacterium sp. Sd200]MXN91248.1 hypothetical protein [Flavobacterium sp. Sd200]